MAGADDPAPAGNGSAVRHAGYFDAPLKVLSFAEECALAQESASQAGAAAAIELAGG